MDKIYESSVETIRETFAVLIGFAVTEFIGDRFKEEGSSDFTAWALSLALILLVLRLFIGTANHMKSTYADIEIGPGHKGNFARTTAGFLKDVAFLITFGVVSILIARSDPKSTESFLKRILLLLVISASWPIVEAIWEQFAHSQARRWWRWWLMLDACQFLFTAIIWRWGLILPLNYAVGVLAGVFGIFFIIDVCQILRVREFQAMGTHGELFSARYAYIGVLALLAGIAICYWFGNPVWPPGPAAPKNASPAFIL